MVSTDTAIDTKQDVFYDSIALTGFISKFSNFAEPYAFTRLFEKNKWKSITAVSDDENFAKKRLTNPKNVYRFVGLFVAQSTCVVSGPKTTSRKHTKKEEECKKL